MASTSTFLSPASDLPSMDTSRQLHEAEATGWQRGLYDDLKRTFRAPFVNWIFRTAMANVPEFLRYAWWQLKPVFGTRQFARYTVAHRDAVLSAVEDDLPAYRRETLGVAPAEYRELRTQLATFDVVSSRLAAFFEVMKRSLEGGDVATVAPTGRATMAPFPDWLDADRGGEPTMVAFDAVPSALNEVIPELKSFHGFDEGLPSIYRCLTQWPTFLARLWDDVGDVLTGERFVAAREAASERTAEFVESLPSAPRLTPEDLRTAGFDDDLVADVRALFRRFDGGPATTVVPALPIFANTVGVAGPRRLD
jgi:hypothetical protein